MLSSWAIARGDITSEGTSLEVVTGISFQICVEPHSCCGMMYVQTPCTFYTADFGRSHVLMGVHCH